jgi:hypothetical protein
MLKFALAAVSLLALTAPTFAADSPLRVDKVLVKPKIKLPTTCLSCPSLGKPLDLKDPSPALKSQVRR